MNTLLGMLLALTCGLAAYADVVPVQDFDLQRMAGKWYLVGFATNAPWFVNNRGNMKVGTAVIVPTEGGDMDLTYTHIKDDGTCWKMTHLAQKTETPGRFTFHSQAWNNDNDMRVVRVLYDNFALIHTIKTKEGASEVLNKLYTRSPDVGVALQQTFTDFCTETGILPENIAILPNAPECPEA
ncbi:lipocalin-like [Hippocampus zosterae]|uniref:lipocalin-like n=1 Tax=Hippocampus zosterae TaxID=109293 RepID=UPI00223CAEFC|nr:lipocalin-like [Hippocampus zosterae]